jgi:hypothetical protein
LLLFGPGLSNPSMVLMSNLVSMLMGSSPVSIYSRAAILGKVGGEMTITDPAVASCLAQVNFSSTRWKPVSRSGVIAVGKLMNKWKFRPEHSQTMESTQAVSPESIPEVFPEQE